MTEKEKMKCELDIAKAKAAKMELEYKILERREDIVRLEEHIGLQDQRIKELEEELASR